MNARADTPARTRPPAHGKPVVLYDGHCDFCTEQARRLERHAPGRLVLRSFQDDGVLDDYPGLTHEQCMTEMKLIGTTGRVYGGAEAVVQSIVYGRTPLAILARAYYIPGVHWIADRVYAWVANNRYRWNRRKLEECATGSCRRHVPH